MNWLNYMIKIGYKNPSVSQSYCLESKTDKEIIRYAFFEKGYFLFAYMFPEYKSDETVLERLERLKNIKKNIKKALIQYSDFWPGRFLESFKVFEKFNGSVVVTYYPTENDIDKLINFDCTKSNMRSNATEQDIIKHICTYNPQV